MTPSYFFPNFIIIFCRFEYDKKMSELSCADEDHPLKQAESLPPKPDTDAGVEGAKCETENLIHESQLI